MFKTFSRHLLGFVVLGLLSFSGFTQDFPPKKTITIVVGFAAGGAADTAARIIAKKLGENIGASVVIDNKGGAGGNIAHAFVATGPTDGSTILFGSVGPLTISPHLYKLPYDPVKDLSPITMGVNFPNVLVVHAGMGIKTFADYVAYAKKNPGKLDYASTGPGSASHLAGELLDDMAKIDTVHVPYKGGAPALQDLLRDIERGLVNVIVVYKIDRLSRSLADFARLVELFEAKNVTFVSVTQHFNTTTSMGRLTLNVLLSFAQFEREVIGERIRDKFAASRRKGMWMGGFVPLGYDVKDRKLVVNKAEAATVRMIFERFIKIGSATELVCRLRAENVRGKQGKVVDKGYVYKLLNNRTYIGEAVHKGVSYPGQHRAIIDRALWDRVHAVLRDSPRRRAANTRAQTPALLKGLIFGPTGRAMTPAHTRKGGKLYRYYVSTDVLKRDADACPVRRIPAAEIESAVVDQLRGLLRTPEVIVGTWRAARTMGDISEAEVREALQRLDPLWDELFPAEQARIVQLLVERIDISPDGADIRLRTEGLTNLVADLRAVRPESRKAA